MSTVMMLLEMLLHKKRLYRIHTGMQVIIRIPRADCTTYRADIITQEQQDS